MGRAPPQGSGTSATFRLLVLLWRRRRRLVLAGAAAVLCLLVLLARSSYPAEGAGGTLHPPPAVQPPRPQRPRQSTTQQHRETAVVAAPPGGAAHIAAVTLRGHAAGLRGASSSHHASSVEATPAPSAAEGVQGRPEAAWRGKEWRRSGSGGECVARLLPHGVWHLSWVLPAGRSHSGDVLDAPSVPLTAVDLPAAGGAAPAVELAAAAAGAAAGGTLTLTVLPAGAVAARAELRRSRGGAVVATAELLRGGAAAAVTLPGARFATGLPERAVPLVLRDGRYRLWNLDVNHYHVDRPDPLYGIVPLVTGVAPGEAAGALWLNAAETHVELRTTGKGVTADIRGAAGIAELLLLPGGPGGAGDVVRQLTAATGAPFMPPLWSLGYHQCRWNYRDERDVLAVSAGFDSHKMQCDAVWLDIEHTDRKHYFTWDRRLFPDPQGMQHKLKAAGRRLITITDPHISRSPGYHVHDEAEAGGFYVKNSDGRTSYHGHCWPGDSSWVDFTSPAAREWYASQFTLEKYQGATEHTHVWIDMNEPSVFSGPETTMHGSALHKGGVPHREVHNIYGHLHSMAAEAGLRRRFAARRSPAERQRPFVLTRSFFAGTQRYAAVWTGDNQAKWSHLAISVPMLLGMSAGGIPFVGADVGGFFDDPAPDLLVRWYQLGALYPFFRGHSHHDTRRREPWLVGGGQRNIDLIAAALRLRYSLLPYLYSAFWRCVLEGMPPMRALMIAFPDAPERVLRRDDVFLLGDALLAAPVLTQGAQDREVHFPSGAGRSEVWFDFAPPHARHSAPSGGGTAERIAVTDASVPLYQRAGTVVLLKEGLDGVRASEDLRMRPYTAQVAVDGPQAEAAGELFLDDGESFNYTAGGFNHKRFVYAGRTFNVTCAHGDDLPSSPYVRGYPPDVPYTPTDGVVDILRLVGVDGEWVARVTGSRGAGAPRSIASQAVPAAPAAIEFRGLELPVQGPWSVELVQAEQ
eukprot:TRINITY_DN35367_c0_g1_i1.p1 TRINITY_DN35367_c0_g1~~TRINITY_DN35367_c0_g1_i1.p1  ORF type:complete len:1002 (+),score=248.14 TRINITY_DN35367_c0_g1_i1:86-3007(+)